MQPMGSSQSSLGVFPVVQMVLALIVVLAMLKWLMPLALKKVQKIKTSGGSGILVQETAAVGQAQLAVITVRGKTLLVGATSSAISCLADLTKVEVPATFHEILETAEPHKPNEDLSDLAGQLERLRRIGG